MVATKYQAGFHECANEVVRYLGSLSGVDSAMNVRVLSFLSQCMDNMNGSGSGLTSHVNHQTEMNSNPQRSATSGLHTVGIPYNTQSNMVQISPNADVPTHARRIIDTQTLKARINSVSNGTTASHFKHSSPPETTMISSLPGTTIQPTTSNTNSCSSADNRYNIQTGETSHTSPQGQSHFVYRPEESSFVPYDRNNNNFTVRDAELDRHVPHRKMGLKVLPTKHIVIGQLRAAHCSTTRLRLHNLWRPW